MSSPPAGSYTKKDGSPVSKDAERYLSRQSTLFSQSSVRTLTYLLDFDKQLAYMMGGVLTGLSLKPIQGGWRAIVKRTRQGVHQVAFLEADTYAALLEALAIWVEGGLFTWYTDRYATR